MSSVTRTDFIICAAWDEFIKPCDNKSTSRLTTTKQHMSEKTQAFHKSKSFQWLSGFWLLLLSALSRSLFPDSVFIWLIQTCRLGIHLCSSRPDGDILSRLLYLPNYNRVPLSIPLWRLRLFYSFSCGGIKFGILSTIHLIPYSFTLCGIFQSQVN